MPAMANRCPPPSLSSPSAPANEPSPSTLSSRTISRSPSPLSGAGVAPQAEISRPQPVAVTSRTGTVVCGLIGKFECTGSDSADVKVTANSCRVSDSALISNRGCPITRGSSPPSGAGEAAVAVGFREIVTGNRNECSDKTATTMGVGGTGGRLGKCSGEMVNAEMDACVHRTRERQRKTVVYSRLCLDDALLEDVGLLQESDTRKSNGPVGHGESGTGAGREAGWSTGQAEVIRFPCVERLIELYANIIRQKEAEVQRFMSSIVRNGDKRRLDKGVSSSADGRRRRATEDGTHGDKLRQGDIRKELSLPASVSLESLSRTKTVQATDLVDDRMRTSSTQSIDEVVRASRTKESSSPAQSDEGWRSSTQPSPYGSSDEEERPVPVEEEPHAETMKNRDKVTRSSSSDSALGLDDDLSQQEQQQMIATVGKVRRLTLGVSDIPLRSALLPVPEPSTLPSVMAVTTEHCPTVVRSKMILEAQLIELPLADGGTGGASDQSGQQQLGCPPSNSVSRRESAQSYISDTGEGVRYVRTPSVVVSDYSDDTMCGITLEEIEYFRRHRLRRGSADCESDISAASSCSNLNYCGSSISALDGCEYQCGLRTPERKVSDCSTCSTVSCDEDEGYSVVRSKLASLRLPSDPVPEETEISPSTELPVIRTSHSNAGATAEDASTTETGDVRVCSKKKVSHEAKHSG
uniref:Uncharacterized protein n=1 Tax=Anopheles minimus TaxID=112268 RepID=A0A182VYC0_9DIPT